MVNLDQIVKKENIIKISPEDILSHVLTKLSTSHDAAFVFDKKNKLQGVINPYYCLIKSSHPGNTKVTRCIYHPPKIYIDYSLDKTAELFIDSKIHYLPVFDRKENFLGIISARRLLFYLKDLPILKTKIENIINAKNKPIVAIYEEDSVARAISLFKSTKLSKLIVINRDMKLRGILSYYDLVDFMMTPQYSIGRGERTGRKIHFFNHQIKNFIKTSVLVLTKDHLLSEVVKLIIDKKIGSVIIVDDERHPIGIITTKDILRFFIQKEKDPFRFINPIKKIFHHIKRRK